LIFRGIWVSHDGNPGSVRGMGVTYDVEDRMTGAGPQSLTYHVVRSLNVVYLGDLQDLFFMPIQFCIYPT